MSEEDEHAESSEQDGDLDVKLSEHDDFNSWWSEYWYKLQKQLGLNPEDPREE